eukprot:TRINITY_DN8306_c0_g2_i4.p2 TRINITY_DN8306_c0_g2~~TRINITY_DN8306_c0_g2_i4.p2  ORF type:complete len:154 (+),score=21.52 TRINITY_DN8306_c0_g2_i4:685-1146(+)
MHMQSLDQEAAIFRSSYTEISGKDLSIWKAVEYGSYGNLVSFLEGTCFFSFFLLLFLDFPKLVPLLIKPVHLCIILVPQYDWSYHHSYVTPFTCLIHHLSILLFLAHHHLMSTLHHSCTCLTHHPYSFFLVHHPLMIIPSSFPCFFSHMTETT